MVQNQDQFNIFLEVAGEVAATAEQAQERVNYGKLTIVPRFMQWITDGNGKRSPEDIDGDTFRYLPKKERSVELHFAVDIQEFRPELEWNYDGRKCMIGSNDWFKILRPSIETVYGDGAGNEKNISETTGKLQGAYVCVADVPQTPKKDQQPDDKIFNTMKLLEVFESREACYAAWQERFGGGDVELEVTGDFPEGWDAESWTHVEAEITKLIEDLPTPIGPRKVATNKLAVLLEKEYGIKPGWLETQL